MAEPSWASSVRPPALMLLVLSICAVMAPSSWLCDAEAPIDRLPTLELGVFSLTLARAMSKPPVTARICSSLLAFRATVAAS